MILSKYLALGVALTDVINACTHTPAVLLGMAAEIGTLALGHLPISPSLN